MGENKHIEELDNFAKKYIQELDVEQPSLDFTNAIMQTLTEVENKEVYKATPLISKKVWVLLIGILVAAIAYVAKGASFKWIKLPELNLSFIPKIKIPNLLEGIVVPDSVMYACFFFTLLIFMQIYFLKNHFNKKLEE